jgi:hypothetical protein
MREDNSGVGRSVAFGGGAQDVERLQQILDVVRHARAGFVDRLHVGLLLELLFPLLRDVELAEQLPEQMKMPDERRARAVAAVERMSLRPLVDGVLRGRAEFA